MRKLFGLTQGAFAAAIYTSKSSISECEADKKVPSNRLLKLISLTFGINETWLITGGGEMSCLECLPSSCREEDDCKGDGGISFMGSVPQRKISEALIMVTRVLESQTSHADELFALIVHSYQTLQTMGGAKKKSGRNKDR